MRSHAKGRLVFATLCHVRPTQVEICQLTRLQLINYECVIILNLLLLFRMKSSDGQTSLAWARLQWALHYLPQRWLQH